MRNLGRLAKMKREAMRQANKNILTELDRETWNRAGDAASEKGLGALSSKFYQHGKEMGDKPEYNEFTFIVRNGNGDQENIVYKEITYEPTQVSVNDNMIIMNLKPTKIGGEDASGNYISDTGTHNYQGSKYRGRITLYRGGDAPVKLKTRKDARILLDVLANAGLDISDVDERSFTDGSATWKDIYGQLVWGDDVNT